MKDICSLHQWKIQLKQWNIYTIYISLSYNDLPILTHRELFSKKNIIQRLKLSTHDMKKTRFFLDAVCIHNRTTILKVCIRNKWRFKRAYPPDSPTLYSIVFSPKRRSNGKQSGDSYKYFVLISMMVFMLSLRMAVLMNFLL